MSKPAHGRLAKSNGTAVGGRPSKSAISKAKASLNDRQLQYAVWVAQPESLREPETEEQFAELIGVTHRTINRWKNLPDVQHAIKWLTLHNSAKPSRIADVMDFLYASVMDLQLKQHDRLAAAKEYLKAAGVQAALDYGGNPVLVQKDLGNIDLEELSEDELYELWLEYTGENVPESELPVPDESAQRDDEVVEAEVEPDGGHED